MHLNISNPKLGDRASSDDLGSVLCDSVRKKQKLQLPMPAFFRPKQPASPIRVQDEAASLSQER